LLLTLEVPGGTRPLLIDELGLVCMHAEGCWDCEVVNGEHFAEESLLKHLLVVGREFVSSLCCVTLAPAESIV
jgi:hypothetical protein